ncbi:hypothetical protein FUAX_27590 [Fulvitalea axinellae]|uniref:HAMP domain-containing protein n=1 Tax=Fulvitalea axinellae TaxID=1182444 RepID=A0AAU9CXW2_9BACT|nr:hypothetical protein FUAX_27590 [Fulvitalea axinellae]
MKIRERLNLLILVPTFLLTGLTVALMTYRFYTKSLEDQIRESGFSTHLFAMKVEDQMQGYMETVRQLARNVEMFEVIPVNERREVLSTFMKNELSSDKGLLAVWSKLEIYALDSLQDEWRGKRGSSVAGNFYYTYYKKPDGSIGLRHSRSTTVKAVMNHGQYAYIKKKPREMLRDPFRIVYGQGEEKSLHCNLLTPIKVNGEFIGVMTADVSMERLRELVRDSELPEACNSILLYNQFDNPKRPEDERYVSASNTYLSDTLLFNTLQRNVRASVKDLSGNELEDMYRYDLEDSKGKRFMAFMIPVKVGKAPERWYYTQLVPYELIEGPVKEIFFQIAGLGLLAMLVLSALVYFTIRSLTVPLTKITERLRMVAQGKKVEVPEYRRNSDNEIDLMFGALRELAVGVDEKASFSAEIGKGNYSKDLKIRSEDDILGKSLVQMKKDLHLADETRKRNEWISEGVQDFSEVMKKEHESLEDLTFQALQKVIRYIDASQGFLYVVDETGEEPLLRLTAAYAWEKQRHLDTRLAKGDGQAGQVWLEGEMIRMTDIPQGFYHINSGLGDAEPKEVVIIPIQLLGVTYGVIELASFNNIGERELDLLDKVLETLAVLLKNNSYGFAEVPSYERR